MSRSDKIGYWQVVSIGIGGMVGGGIFAVLGLAVQLAHGGTPVAFLIAGAVALLTAYAYAKLSVLYPSQGGTVIFLDRAFGVDVLTGSMNNLLWLSYVVMLALYAFAFGSYAAALLPSRHPAATKHLLISAALVLPMLLNLLSAGIVAKTEDYVVAVKIAILLLFVGAGFPGVEIARIAPSSWSPTLSLVSGGMLIFVAYEGFELMANAAEDLRDVRKILPRALYSAVGFVILLYVLVSIVTVGNLDVGKIVDAKDYALAEAARPFLGSRGFVLIAAAALLSTFSAINATLYGSARLCYTIAKEGELPKLLEKTAWSRPVEGLAITTALALLLANLGDLSSISTMGSAGFLLIFLAVNAACYVEAAETRSRRWICAAGVVACALALAALVWQTATTSPDRLWILLGMAGLAASIEAGYRAFAGRKLRLG